MTIRKYTVAAALTVLGLSLLGCGKGDSGGAGGGDKPVKLAFITNNVSDFWKIASAGVKKAEQEFNVTCEVKMPPQGTAEEQQRIIEDLLAKGVHGIAISPKDSANQTAIINQAVDAGVPVVCHDSDAPQSKRVAFVGSNNFKAGQVAGGLVKELLPNGGKIMLFVGMQDVQNAQERIGGLKDAIKDTKIEVLDVRTDNTDRARAKQNVEDTITKHPDIACLVGLWSYNGPQILAAVKESGNAGKIPIVCFDEEDATLQGVMDGEIHATVVQQPYMFGYDSVRILAALAREQDAKIPADKIVDVPVTIIRKDNVKAFWDDLKAKVGA